jgi:hypothetical protein
MSVGAWPQRIIAMSGSYEPDQRDSFSHVFPGPEGLPQMMRLRDRAVGETRHALADVPNMGGYLLACAPVQESA